MRIFFIRSRILFCGLLNNPDIVILSLTSISCMHFQVIKIDNRTCLHTEFQYRWRVVNRISLRFSLSIKVGIPHFIFITLLWHKIRISNCQRVMDVVQPIMVSWPIDQVDSPPNETTLPSSRRFIYWRAQGEGNTKRRQGKGQGPLNIATSSSPSFRIFFRPRVQIFFSGYWLVKGIFQTKAVTTSVVSRNSWIK